MAGHRSLCGGTTLFCRRRNRGLTGLRNFRLVATFNMKTYNLRRCFKNIRPIHRFSNCTFFESCACSHTLHRMWLAKLAVYSHSTARSFLRVGSGHARLVLPAVRTCMESTLLRPQHLASDRMPLRYATSHTHSCFSPWSSRPQHMLFC